MTLKSPKYQMSFLKLFSTVVPHHIDDKMTHKKKDRGIEKQLKLLNRGEAAGSDAIPVHF